MIKAIFFDIDGTLVSFKTHRVPTSTVEALGRLREKGIKTFISTGRQYKSIDNLGNLQFDGYITLNGGYCMTGNNHQVIHTHSICEADIEALIQLEQQGNIFPCAYVTQEGIFLNYTTEEVEGLFKLINFPPPPIRPLSAMRGQTTYQLLAFLTPGTQEDEVMKHLPHCEATRWNPIFADIIPAGSNKAVGMEKIMEHFGFATHETMAFGDGGNDVGILTRAGIGVAMGNAGDEVKAIANYITTSVDEEGIHNALTHFKLI